MRIKGVSDNRQGCLTRNYCFTNTRFSSSSPFAGRVRAAHPAVNRHSMPGSPLAVTGLQELLLTMENNTIQETIISTPLGSCVLLEGTEGVLRLKIFAPATSRREVGSFSRQWSDELLTRLDKTEFPIPKIVRVFSSLLSDRIVEYLNGSVDDFTDIRVDLYYATPFQKDVYDSCRKIPYGEIRSYGELATEAGRPKAARAVGSFMARNLTPLIIPCHRVLPVNQHIGNYSGGQGPETKRLLLEMEARSRPQETARKTVK